MKAKNIFILSQTEPWEILVRMAIPTRTACARGYSHAHNTLILVNISVRVAKSRARILYTNTQAGQVKLGQVKLGEVKAGQVKSRQVKLLHNI